MTSFAALQRLYDTNRFLEAFHQSADYWNPARRIDELSCDELILGARLAARLGGRRLSRWLLGAALNRYPHEPRALYFASHVRLRGSKLFEQLRESESTPELPGADSRTQADWLASRALVWASVRDFTAAHRSIERASFYEPNDCWVFSCEADVLGLEDRWDDALGSAERAWEINPGAPYAAHSLGQSLLNLRRVREAADRLSAAAESCQSFEVACGACWHLCALAETLEQDERRQTVSRARALAANLPSLAPLADRETRALLARVWLDIAQQDDDHSEMERWADEARSPFHRAVLKNLRANPDGRRIRLPFRCAIQKHDACLPTSVASALEAMGAHIDPDVMASEITFGGTPEWAAAEWLENRGFCVRYFPATPDTARQLVNNGIAFIMTLEGDASAHAVAVVGIDEAAGTLIVHDPQAFRASEYLSEYMGRGEAPLGPKAMAVVTPAQLPLLERLLPEADSQAIAATERHHQMVTLHGPAAARELVQDFARRYPSHPVTRLLVAVQATHDGQLGAAVADLQDLLRAFPNSAPVRGRILSACRSLGNTALTRETLATVVDRGVVPGIQSQQNWLYPPGNYVAEYADLLRLSAETRDTARSLLDGVLLREPTCAFAWHVLGELLWSETDTSGALLAYRIAACLADSWEHYARAYCDALGNCGRAQEGLEWLGERVRRFGSSARAVSPWTTWIGALEQWGHPQEALRATEQSLDRHPDSAELLAFVVPFAARMGQWERAEALLGRLATAGNSALFHQAAVAFHRMRGDLEKSIEYAHDCVRESPLSTEACGDLLQLTAKRDGPVAAMDLASRWRADHPGHDGFEQLYSQQLDRVALSQFRKYLLLRRRARRNPQDGWTWRELVFLCCPEYQSADDRRRGRLGTRINNFLEQCQRISPEAAATLRAQTLWSEARGKWSEALDGWLESIRREPESLYAYEHALNCLARFEAAERKRAWEEISAHLPTHSGRLFTARYNAMRAAEMFGLTLAEQSVSRWAALRADDPEVLEARADLLLEHGHGRTDAQRALEILAPAVERHPYHIGLRSSFANALHKLGKFEEAEQVLADLVRRHPDDSSAHIQLARVHEQGGRLDKALQVLESASHRDPQNAELWDMRAQMLIRARRFKEADATVRDGLSRFPRHVHWRERAIALLLDCGQPEAAIEAAREGVRVYPRGAYLWFLLGTTLGDLRHFATHGEIEKCLRHSLALNQGLFAAADRLAIFLVEQRRYAEAEQVIVGVRERLSDPTPANGRLAWIHYEQGKKKEARDEMASLLRAVPWYLWGWMVLHDALVADEAWDDARTIFMTTPVELQTHTRFRRQRLVLLEKAGLSPAELDSEWNALLGDFPEDLAVHLQRYDSLRSAKRMPEAAKVLELARARYPENLFVLARFVEVLGQDQRRKEEAIRALLTILFADGEDPSWAVDYAWGAAKAAKWEHQAYEQARERLRHGSRPTPRALSQLCSYALMHYGTFKQRLQPRWRTWFPDKGARETVAMLNFVDSSRWTNGAYRTILLRHLCDFGYHRAVLRYWRKHKVLVETDVQSWSETARALVGLKESKLARTLLADWRSRTGVPMWAVANYVMCFSPRRSSQLREVVSSCRDALVGLPHDHCAKYLVHRQAEACALLRDLAGFQQVCQKHANYLTGKLEPGEWFDSRSKHLLTDIPVMARALRQRELALYRRTLRAVRWKRISGGFHLAVAVR
jgi:predicted Zn-dependent protease